MSEKILNRLQDIAEARGLSLEDFVMKIELGSLRLVDAKLYSVMLTTNACKWLQDKGISSFIRRKLYYAIDPQDAFMQFKEDFPLAEELMVNITEI
ncbi:hypothetical protein PCC6912_40330 [Chlorogloeopsis fritschii PCC 6912]|uniref:Uncharacterized protein n=1 Tax=Chlorogloeopsis fritschii PCC 6912 TaxID=211165 RepID=A0A433N6G1_CHLFR|nr:hypothetical protein [Chlorogloeopsis fritschii]RUR77074.1 hypothetical protein PCC6912_40330 [Chlorogloeopsis fritschii PCC 6912]